MAVKEIMTANRSTQNGKSDTRNQLKKTDNPRIKKQNMKKRQKFPTAYPGKPAIP